MARTRSTSLTPVEAAIMSVLWNRGPSTVATVTEQLPGGRHYNTVLTILRILETKGYVRHKDDPDGRGYLYTAAVTREAATAQAADDVAARFFQGDRRAFAAWLTENVDTKQPRRRRAAFVAGAGRILAPAKRGRGRA